MQEGEQEGGSWLHSSGSSCKSESKREEAGCKSESKREEAGCKSESKREEAGCTLLALVARVRARGRKLVSLFWHWLQE